MENNYPENLEALHSESVAHRLMRVALWTIGFIMCRLVINNTVGFFINRDYVIASTQSSIPKVSTTVAALCDNPVQGLLINLGDMAAAFLYPIAMSFFFVWFGWKIASWLNLAGYAAAAFVYYHIGPQATQGADQGLNGLPMYVLIPAVSFAACVVIQLIFNLIVAKNPFKVFVKPCYSDKNRDNN